jgi:transposase
MEGLLIEEVSSVLSCSSGGKRTRHRKELRERDDDLCRETGHQGRGDVRGVDTHLDFHTAVAVDHLGRGLGELSVPTTAKGYERLLCWAEGFGPVRCAGIEGTSSYGVGLARHLKAQGIEVLEVERPKRRDSEALRAVTSSLSP